MKKIGQRVRILGGLPEFIGKTGTIIEVECHGRPPMYRVKLDDEVEVPHVGLVRDDLWSGHWLKNVRL